MSKTNAQHKAAQRARDKARKEAHGITDLQFPVPAVRMEQLKALMAEHGFEDWRELLLVVIDNLATMETHTAAAVLYIKPAGFVPTPKQLERVSRRRACELCGDTLTDKETGDDCQVCN